VQSSDAGVARGGCELTGRLECALANDKPSVTNMPSLLSELSDDPFSQVIRRPFVDLRWGENDARGRTSVATAADNYVSVSTGDTDALTPLRAHHFGCDFGSVAS
jgi:hypothetical protein